MDQRLQKDDLKDGLGGEASCEEVIPMYLYVLLLTDLKVTREQKEKLLSDHESLTFSNHQLSMGSMKA